MFCLFIEFTYRDLQRFTLNILIKIQNKITKEKYS